MTVTTARDLRKAEEISAKLRAGDPGESRFQRDRRLDTLADEVAKIRAEERQEIIDAIYRRFIGGASGDPTAVDIIGLIRERGQ